MTVIAVKRHGWAEDLVSCNRTDAFGRPKVEAFSDGELELYFPATKLTSRLGKVISVVTERARRPDDTVVAASMREVSMHRSWMWGAGMGAFVIVALLLLWEFFGDLLALTGVPFH